MSKASNTITGFTSKRALIDKANTTTIIAAGVAAFLVVFSLVSAKSFVGQISYQNKVISAKKDTKKTLDKNLEARDTIVKSYESFVGTSQNLMGGSTTLTEGDKDGDNAKLILDALPSKYDFPAVLSGLEKMAFNQGLAINKIEGTDDEVGQSSQQSSSSPKPIPMAFVIEVKGSYPQLKSYMGQLDLSIRPFQMQKYTLESTDQGVTEKIEAQTFYQPQKLLELKKEVLMPNGSLASPTSKSQTPAATGTTTTGVKQ